MLDKRTAHFLGVIAKICEDGSYKIIEKAELVTQMRTKAADFNMLNQMVRFLQDNEMIDVKYSDETVFCLTVLPKGRVSCESTRRRVSDVLKINNKTLLILILACFVASLFGSMLGTLFMR